MQCFFHVNKALRTPDISRNTQSSFKCHSSPASSIQTATVHLSTENIHASTRPGEALLHSGLITKLLPKQRCSGMPNLQSQAVILCVNINTYHCNTATCLTWAVSLQDLSHKSNPQTTHYKDLKVALLSTTTRLYPPTQQQGCPLLLHRPFQGPPVVSGRKNKNKTDATLMYIHRLPINTLETKHFSIHYLQKKT